MEIVVQNGETKEEILRFASPQDGAEVLQTLWLATGHHGILKNRDGLAFTKSNKDLPPGTYDFHMPVREMDDEDSPGWKMRLAAVGVALLVFGILPQGLIILSFMLRCGYHWNCSFSHFRGFINYIDGPFKLITFSSAIHGAWSKPERWIPNHRASSQSSPESGVREREGEGARRKKTKLVHHGESGGGPGGKAKTQ